MNPERSLLASIIQSRGAYELVEGRLSEDDLTEQGRMLLRAVAAYYERDAKAGACDRELLANAIARTLANPKHRAMFETLVGELASMEVSPANVMSDYFAMKREDAGNRLASALLSRNESALPDLLDEYQRWQESPTGGDDTTESVMQGLSVAELVGTHHTPERLIKVLPKALNDRLEGGVLPGNHIVLFARPEMGKTMMVINMMAGFVRQGLKVLYMGNEDPIPDIVMRTVCRLAGRTRGEVLAHPDEADKLARENGYNSITFVGLAPGTPKEIERLVKMFKPAVTIVDQIRNMHMREDNRVTQLEKAATFHRNLAKRYGLIAVSITQAGDSASGKAVLDMGDVDFSNTGIPATADVMIGMGASAEDEASERRVLSLPKNKRGGDHSWFAVSVDRMRSRVTSLE